MKLTDDIIDQLIQEQVELNEKTIPVKITLAPRSDTIDRVAKDLGVPSWRKLPGKNKQTTAKNLKALSSLDGESQEISAVDIQKAVERGGVELDTLGRIKKNTNDPDLARSIEDEYSQAVKAQGAETGTIKQHLPIDPIDVQKVQSLTFPRVMQSDANIQKGIFLGSQNELMKSIFSAGTIEGRLREMADVSREIMGIAEDIGNNPQQTQAGTEFTRSPRKTLQYSMFVDLCNHYINESDTRSGGYLFEALCAQICGGAVGGGANGVADFTTGDGSKGSSKLYTNWKDIKQSASDTTWKAGEAVHYVIGMKQKGKVNEELKEGEKYVGVDLHYIVVTKTEQDNDIATFATSNANADVLSIQKMPVAAGNLIDVIKDATEEETKVGTLRLYAGRNSFKEVLETKYKGDETDTGKAFAAVKQFFRLLFEAEQSTKEYIATSEPDKAISAGEEAQKKYAAAGPELNTIIELLSMAAHSSGEDAATPGAATPPQQNENNQKITEKMLDILLKEVILTK
jgi:hypothetical protein